MISESLEKQSQRWWFRYLRWDGFGCVPGILGSVAVSLDVLQVVRSIWNQPPSALVPLFSLLLPKNASFVSILGLSIALGVLSIVEPIIILKKIDRSIITEEDPKELVNRFLRLRNAFALYTFSMAVLCALYAILD